jgi:predicted 3-demethylubiquinone-9 3-methyltransferase (glyoxalase superfamily)
MFDGQAEEAIRFYLSVVKDSRMVSVVRYGKNQAGKEGSVMRAEFNLAGQRVVAIDSPAKHDFSFTPSFSLLVDCTDQGEIDQLFARLSEGGSVRMPPDCYGFSQKFAWLSDRYGVSWQLNLPHPMS